MQAETETETDDPVPVSVPVLGRKHQLQVVRARGPGGIATSGEPKVAIWDPGAKRRVACRERPRAVVGLAWMRSPGGGTAGAGLAMMGLALSSAKRERETISYIDGLKGWEAGGNVEGVVPARRFT